MLKWANCGRSFAPDPTEEPTTLPIFLVAGEGGNLGKPPHHSSSSSTPTAPRSLGRPPLNRATLTTDRIVWWYEFIQHQSGLKSTFHIVENVFRSRNTQYIGGGVTVCYINSCLTDIADLWNSDDYLSWFFV